MSFSYGNGSNFAIDSVRMLVADTNAATPVWTDEEILMGYQIASPVAFIPPSGTIATVYASGSPRMVAATLLDSLASNQARLASSLEVLDIKISLGEAAKSLRDQANALREAEQEGGSFALVEQVHDIFTYRTRVMRQFQRTL